MQQQRRSSTGFPELEDRDMSSSLEKSNKHGDYKTTSSHLYINTHLTLSSSMKDFIRVSYNIKMVFELLIMLSWLSVARSETQPSLAKPGCQQKCGNTTIAYPFGIGSQCYHNEWFEITCNKSFNPAKPYITKHNLELLGINLATQTVRVNMPVIFNCTKGVGAAPWTSLDLGGSPFSFSRQFNGFIPVGCNGSSLSYYGGRIMASCGDPVCADASGLEEVFRPCGPYRPCGPNSCNGPYSLYGPYSTYGPYSRYGPNGPQGQGPYQYTTEGICQANQPPNGLTSYSVNITEANGTCHYVRLTEIDPSIGYQVNLPAASLKKRAPTPVVLVWLYDLFVDPSSEAFRGGGPCDLMAYLLTGVYSCSCPQYQAGNPYLPNGCQDVGATGSDFPQGNGYSPNGPKHRWVIPLIKGLSVAIGSILLLIGIYWLYRITNCIKRWQEFRRKANNFKRNGGLLLQQQISSNEGAIDGTKVFASSELDTATDHFNKNRILGQGGQGTVYKGMLVDGRIIAVKKAEKVVENQLEQFVNEMVILSQINHRNIVKLLGCCLETDVPLLVYEYISNGTLFHHIHDPTEEFPITWKMRLQIAIDVAGAVAYLHSASSIPIFHRDIKSSNILLDEKYKAKVADFGASKSIPIDQTHVITCVQGTFGYVDPEYFQSHQLTEKSDVYSFGVVLVELLTGQRPIRSAFEEERSLVGYFLSSMENSSLLDIVDSRVMKECREEDALAFASLARQCLHLSGKQRPTMKEVAMVLEGIKSQDLRQDHLSTCAEPDTKIEAAGGTGEDYGHFSFSSISMDWGSSEPLDDQSLRTNTF